MDFIPILFLILIIGMILLSMELDSLVQLFVRILTWGGIILILVILYEVLKPRF